MIYPFHLTLTAFPLSLSFVSVGVQPLEVLDQCQNFISHLSVKHSYFFHSSVLMWCHYLFPCAFPDQFESCNLFFQIPHFHCRNNGSLIIPICPLKFSLIQVLHSCQYVLHTHEFLSVF